jgi:hypothetical protein
MKCCERRQLRADDQRNDERTRFSFAKSDDRVGLLAQCASSSEKGLTAW